MNNTIGDLERLSWGHYCLGAFLGLTFMSISILNILFLKCFYNLRQQAFVRNSMALISLIVTDLANAIILTPTLCFWFLLPPPNDYTSCLIKSLPFMLSNYTSLLNMTCFCVYRFILIKNVAVGKIKVRTSKYSLATLGIWAAGVIDVSVPYIVWNNSDRIILDCRRAMFSDVNSALGMFALLFDIPLILMNLTLFTLFILFKKNQAKVSVGSISGHAQSNISNATENDAAVQGMVNMSKLKKSSSLVKENAKELAHSSRKLKALTENLAREGKLFEDEFSSIISPDIFQFNIVPISVTSSLAMPSPLATARHEEFKFHNTALDSCNASSGILHENQIYTGTHCEKQVDNINNSQHQTETVHGGKLDECQNELKSTNSTERGAINISRKVDERGYLLQELKRSFVTMGILVAVYDVTVLPLIIDINMGATDPKFLMPHVLNSFCFLNSFANPLVYLIRMKKMRQEMKSILRQCYSKMFCSRWWYTDDSE